MNPGTYTGSDGRTYRWVTGKHSGLVNHQVNLRLGDFDNWCSAGIDPADWPLAKSALDALIENEAVEWVEIPAPNGEDPYIRISRNGSRVQERSQEGRWNDYDAWWIKAAYRKGREVALEQVKELVEAVLEYVDNPRIMPEPQRRLRALAQAVKA